MGRGTSIAAAAAALLFAASVGCVSQSGELDTDTPPVVESECPDDDLVVAEACDDVYCGAPEVTIGAGGSDFQPLGDGAAQRLYFGSNGGTGGYHLFLSVQTEHLCPIVWLEPSVEVETDDGEVHEVYTERLHVLAVRPEENSSRQIYWGIRAPVPCSFWPSDPSRDATCGEDQSRDGHIDDLRVRLSIVAEDHDDRASADERWVDVECCGD